MCAAWGGMNAYEEGREAFRRWDSLGMNPYDDKDAQFDEWEEGYIVEQLLYTK